MKSKSLAVGLVAIIAILAIGISIWALSQDDDDERYAIGDTFTYEMKHDNGEIEYRIFTVVDTYGDLYVLQETRISYGEAYYVTHCYVEDPRIYGTQRADALFEMEAYTIIPTIVGDVECKVMRAGNDEVFLRSYWGPDGTIYSEEFTSPEYSYVMSLIGDTTLGISVDMEVPGYEAPVIAEMDYRSGAVPGDGFAYYDNTTDTETVYTVISADDYTVTYEVDGITMTSPVTDFMDLMEKKSDYDLDGMYFDCTRLEPISDYYMLVDIYYTVEWSDSGFIYDEYWFDSNTGLFLGCLGYDGEARVLLYTSFINIYVEGVSEDPRIIPVCGDTFTIESTIEENGKTAVYSSEITMIGAYEGQYVFHLVATDENGHTYEAYPIVDDLDMIICIDVEGLDYIGTETITTSMGERECEVYRTVEGDTIETYYVADGMAVYATSTDGSETRTVETVLNTLYLHESMLSEPDVDVPSMDTLKVKDQLAVGDTFAIQYRDIEYTDTYTITAIENDVVTYTVGETTATCTVLEFLGFIKTLDDFDVDSLEYSVTGIVELELGTFPVNVYYDEFGVRYGFDDGTGILLYIDDPEDGYVEFVGGSVLYTITAEFDDVREEVLIGDFAVAKYNHSDGSMYFVKKTLIGTYEGRYLVEYVMADDDSIIHFATNVTDGFYITEPIPEDAVMIGTETIHTAFGYLPCSVYMYYQDDYVLYCGPNGVIYRTINFDDPMIETMDIIFSTLFGDGSDVTDPGVEIPDINEFDLKHDVEVGDYIVFSDVDGTHTCTVTHVEDGMVTYDLDGLSYTCTITEFFDYLVFIYDFEIEGLTYCCSIITENPESAWGDIILDHYYVEYDDGTGRVDYWFESSSGMLLETIYGNDDDYRVLYTTLITTFVDGISEVPRQYSVPGDYVVYDVTAESDSWSNTYVDTDTVIGTIDGKSLIRCYNVHPSGTEYTSYYIDDLNFPANVEGKVYVGSETVPTFRGDIVCDVFTARYDGTELTIYEFEGLVYKYIQDSDDWRYTFVLKDTSRFMAPDTVVDPGYDYPTPDMLSLRGELVAGDTIVLNGTVDNVYTVISVDGDNVTYDADGTTMTTTVDGFYDILKTVDDFEDLTYNYTVLMNTGTMETFISSYTDPYGDFYYFDYATGILLVIDETDGETIYTESSLFEVISGDVPQVRSDIVTGDTVERLFRYVYSSGEVSTNTYCTTYLNEHDGADVVQYTLTDDETSHNFGLVADFKESLMPNVSESECIGKEIITTPFGYVLCDVLVEYDEDETVVVYIGPNDAVYRSIRYSDDYIAYQDVISTTLYGPAETVVDPSIDPPQILKPKFRDLAAGDCIEYSINADRVRSMEIVSVGDLITYEMNGEQWVCTEETLLAFILTKESFDGINLEYLSSVLMETYSGDAYVAADMYTDDEDNTYIFDRSTGVLLTGFIGDDLIILDECDIIELIE